MRSLAQWLEQRGFPQYAQVFAENDVDLEALRLLSDADLKQLGISLGHRRKLLQAIAELNSTFAATRPDDEVVEDHSAPELRDAKAERRQLTVMFCDLVGSTPLSERLDPEDLREMLHAYQRTCRQIIARYDGYVAQYRGDGVLVYFGWPRAHEDDAARAMHAGLELTEAIPNLPTAEPLNARIGIHTGMVVVGEAVSGDAAAPKDAIGDTPNIAARLEALAEQNTVVVSERTCSLAPGVFDYSDLGPHMLKGISEPVRLFRIDRARVIASRFEAASSERPLAPFIAREEEIGLLLHRWQNAKEGEGQVVLLSAEPGIGKSRLITELQVRLRQEGHLLLRHQCSPYHTNSALYPLAEHLERAAGFAADDSAEQKLDKMEAMLAGADSTLSEAAPLFARLLSLPTNRYPPLNVSAQKQKEQTLEALARRLVGLARQQPLLIVYEDVHWIDATSQEALDSLVPRLRNLPVLMIVTYRPEYIARWTDQAHVAALGLNRLGRRHTGELVGQLTGGKMLPPEVFDHIVMHTDGVPLFIEELTKSVLESPLLREVDNRYALEVPLPALAIPTTLRDSLMARLDRLASVREVAQIAACMGREFSFKLLRAVASLSPAALENALQQLLSTGLLHKRGVSPQTIYTFKHALVQDAAYDSMLKSKRVQIHARIAQAIEAHMPETTETEPELLARHYTEAGLAEPAVGYWLKAAKRGISRSAYREAEAHISVGMNQLPRLPVSEKRALLELELQLQRAIALQALKGMSAADTGAAFAAAKALSQRVGEDARQIFPALFGIYIFHIARAEYELALEVGRQALRRAEQSDDVALLLVAHRMIGPPLHYRGEFAEAIRHLKRALDLFEPQRDGQSSVVYGLDSKAACLSILSQSLFVVGNPDDALLVAHEAVKQAEATSHAHSIAHTLAQLCGVRFIRSEPEKALAEAKRTMALSEKHGLEMQYQVAKGNWGAALIELGEVEQGMALLGETLRGHGDRLGLRIARAAKLRRLATGAAMLGRWEQATEHFEAAFAEVEISGERWYEAELDRSKGEFLLERDGDSGMKSAEACFAEALAVARSQGAEDLGIARVDQPGPTMATSGPLARGGKSPFPHLPFLHAEGLPISRISRRQSDYWMRWLNNRGVRSS